MVQSVSVGLLMWLLTHLAYATVITSVESVDVDSYVAYSEGYIYFYPLIGKYSHQWLFSECV